MFLPMSCTSPLTVAITMPLACVPPGDFSVRLHEGLQVGHRLLHGAGALHHLGQEHLARAEQVADDLHAVHQRALDDVERARGLLAGLLHVLLDEVDDPVHQGVRQPLLRRASRQRVKSSSLLLALVPCTVSAKRDQPLGRVGRAG